MNHILETVTLEYPNFNLSNIKYCMSDFEPAILGAMKVAFPSAVAKGCWFHYGQAIYRKTSELGLSVTYKQKGVVTFSNILVFSVTQRIPDLAE